MPSTTSMRAEQRFAMDMDKLIHPTSYLIEVKKKTGREGAVGLL